MLICTWRVSWWCTGLVRSVQWLRYKVRNRGIMARFPVQANVLCSIQSVKPTLGSTISPIQWITRALFQGGRQNRRSVKIITHVKQCTDVNSKWANCGKPLKLVPTGKWGMTNPFGFVLPTSFSVFRSIRRSKWPRGLRHRSAAARLLRLWVRIPLGAWISAVMIAVFCQVEISATGWSLVQRSPTDCVATLCVI